MHDIEWRWADPSGQQRRIRLDELRAALAGGLVAPNAPVWKAGWPQWVAARDVPELQSSALSAQNGLLPNIPPPPLAVVAAQSAFEAQSGPSQSAAYAEPPSPPYYVPIAASAVHGVLPSSPVSAPPTTVPLAPGSGPKVHAEAKPPASAPKVEAPAPEPAPPAVVVAPVVAAAPIEPPKPIEVAPAPRSAPRSAEKVTAPPRASTQLGMAPAAIPKDRPSQKVTRPEIQTEPAAAPPAAPAAPNTASLPPDELSWSSLELTDAEDTGAHPIVDVKKAPPLPAEARRPSGMSPAVRGSTPPPPNVRASVPPAMIAAGLTRPSSPPPAAQAPLAEELSSSALLLDDSNSYSYVSPRSKPPSKAPSMPPKAPSIPPPARPGPSRPPPPVPMEELSSSLLEADASGAFPLEAPRLATLLRNNAPVEELSSSALTSAESTSAIPIVPAAAVAQLAAQPPTLLTPAAAPALAASLPSTAPPANGASAAVSIPTSLFGSPSPLVAPVPTPAPAPAAAGPRVDPLATTATAADPLAATKGAADPLAATAGVVDPLAATAGAPDPLAATAGASGANLFGRKDTPTSLGAPPGVVSVPTSLFGTQSPLAQARDDGSAPPVVKDTNGAPPPSSSGSSAGISVPTSIGIGLPVGEVASHPVVVPPPANQPTSEAAAYFERADKDEPRSPSKPEPETQEDMLEGLVAPSPIDRAKKALGPLLARLKTLSESENPLFLPGVVAASTVFTLMFLGVVYAASPDSTPSTKAVASASAHPSSEAPSSAPPPKEPPKEVASSAPPPPPPPAAVGASCKLSGEPVQVADKTSIAAGIEVLAEGGMLAIGYASAPKEGQLVRLGEGLAPTAAGHLKMGEPIRRVQPLVQKGKLQMAVEIDKRILGMTSRRAVVQDPPFDIGILGSSIGSAGHLRNGAKELFAVPGEGPIEALRVAPLGAEKGAAIAFRHAGTIYVGIAKGEDLAVQGELQKAAGVGDKVGSPAIAVSGDQWLAVFADRTGEAPWGLRMFGGKVGGTAFSSKAFTAPAGGPGGATISPSLVPLGGGAFLLTWTEGPDKGHQVRAQVLDAAGDPSGDAFAVSPAGTDAGQARGAVDANGKGVLAYFGAKDEGFRLVAVPLACGK